MKNLEIFFFDTSCLMTRTNDFDGGLMHAYRHCSWNRMKLSSSKGDITLNSLWDFPLFIGTAILTDNDSEQKFSTTFEDDGRVWQRKYHIDPDTKVYYLKTAFANRNSLLAG